MYGDVERAPVGLVQIDDEVRKRLGRRDGDVSQVGGWRIRGVEDLCLALGLLKESVHCRGEGNVNAPRRAMNRRSAFRGAEQNVDLVRLRIVPRKERYARVSHWDADAKHDRARHAGPQNRMFRFHDNSLVFAQLGLSHTSGARLSSRSPHATGCVYAVARTQGEIVSTTNLIV